MYQLNKVKWNYGAYQIGVASFRLPHSGIFQVEVLQVDRQGNRKYPGWFEMDVAKIRTYPTQQVGKNRNITVYLVPIGDWDRKGLPEPEPVDEVTTVPETPREEQLGLL